MPRALDLAQAAALAAVLRRLSRGRDRRPALVPRSAAGAGVSVVVPARDEAARIGPCLAGLLNDPGLLEVIVVDDRSTDGTAAAARAAGACVVHGREPPDGWVGKPWALQQGVEAARGDVVVCVDADTRPRPGLAGALAHAAGERELVTASARFVCESPGERLLHPSFLASLIVRFGPAHSTTAPAPDRVLSNGQCTAVRREEFLAAGGYRRAAAHMTDDAALARSLARDGWRVTFHPAEALIEVKMHDSAAEVWREWGRSLALADVTGRAWLAADVAVVWLAQGLPVLRVVTGRARALDWLFVALRLALIRAMRPGYTSHGAAYFASILADPATAVRLTWSAVRPPRRWRGREYAVARTGSRSGT